jgi:hypothetical protein
MVSLLKMAFVSWPLLELDAQLQLSLDLNFLQANDYQVIRPLIMELIKKISALRASQLKRVEQ